MTRYCLVTLGLALAHPAVADELPGLDDDGWHSWRVAAVEGAPSWCCGSWNAGVVTATSCSLDDRDGHYGSDDRFASDPVELQLYARIEDDSVRDLRIYDSRCPVESQEPFSDHGVAANADSVRWLEQRAGDSEQLRSHGLMAIAAHEGEDASRALERYAGPGQPIETRKQALFWIGQLRMDDAGDTLRRALEKDDSASIREHALFAYSQSSAGDRFAVLTMAGKTDRSPDVRGHAWLWLAQTGLDGAEAEIRRAVASEPDDDARDEAVFALSQLPDAGTAALLDVLEDQGLPRDTREQALFWLVQSDSADAWAYLDELLTQ